MRRMTPVVLLGFVVAGATPAGALIEGVERVDGLPGRVIAPPARVHDDEIASATHMLGFNERQNVVLTQPLAVDGGEIPSGTMVSSHMILLNLPNGAGRGFGVNDWTFAEPILGVMSDAGGLLEDQSTPFLGAPETDYPSRYPYRGIEGNDGYLILGPRTLRVTFYVWQPGDWIRVITAAAPVAEATTPGWIERGHVTGRIGPSARLTCSRRSHSISVFFHDVDKNETVCGLGDRGLCGDDDAGGRRDRAGLSQ